MLTPLPCPRCDKTPSITWQTAYTIHCANCYDPTPIDSESRNGRNELVWGWTPEAAIEDWNEFVRSFIERQYEKEMAAYLDYREDGEKWEAQKHWKEMRRWEERLGEVSKP